MGAKTEPSLVDLLANAGEAELADIDERITAKQAELDEATKRIGGELEALRQLRKVIDIKLNGKPAREYKRKPKVKPGEPTPAVAKLIETLRGSGPCSTRTLAIKTGLDEHGIRLTLGKNKHLFMKDEADGTWELVA